MCQQVKSKDLRSVIQNAAVGRLRNSDFLFNYLQTVGIVSLDTKGLISVSDDVEERIQRAVRKVEVGSIVWTGIRGLFLVIDSHPKVGDDGHHFVAVRVTTDEDGLYKLIPDEYPIVLEDIDLIFIKQSTFDIRSVVKFVEERTELVNKVIELTNTINSLREKDNG